MKHHLFTTLGLCLLCAIALVVVACAPPQNGSARGLRPGSGNIQLSVEGHGPLVEAQAAEPLVELSRADLACRLGIDGAKIEVLSAEEVQWPDASLGCPQPGMAYAQVQTPGFKIMLQARGQTYTYHTDEGRTAVLCQDQGLRQPILPVDPDNLRDGEPWMPAD